ncbi:MAG: hypothetical protein HWE20_00835 [Gammaproteobacteria bacterium]|nr:hypothetical protein [Gammaproteobacteria bacterium]
MDNSHPWYRVRRYLHFDPPVGLKSAIKIATNPSKVSRHSFYPLISYHVTSKKLKRNKETGELKPKIKNRPISYAAHMDSHIYSYYAWSLSELYENKLREKGISECVLAFRSLGKSNIDFALDAFNEISTRKNCSAVALDISGFFDNLDHKLLKESWVSLLDKKNLPPDHYSVFKSLTQFSTVDKEILYKKLNISPNNPKKDRYRICEPQIFRDVVRANGMVNKHSIRKGIPQGTPISALLSNIYMIDFDVWANEEVKKVGGRYFRYCDDMLFILPRIHKNRVEGLVREHIRDLLIDINVDKTEIRDFRLIDGVVTADKPLQYLGFTFDGQRILIRSAALARYSEKMKRGVRLAKATMRKRNRLRVERGEAPKKLFRNKVYEQYSHLGKRNFIRYGLRSAEIMNSKAMKKQLKPLWERLIKEIET